METFQEHYDSLMRTIARRNMNVDMQAIERAIRYAEKKHASQKRKDGSPYIIHPLAVAEIVAEIGLDTDAILGALLHDCIEDTDSTYDDISRQFGSTVAALVEGVTKLTRVEYSTLEEQQMENLRKMFMAMSRDIRVILIKIADRLHNTRTMQYQSPEKQILKSRETMDIYAPLAHRLGMQKIKWELEDTSLKYLDPAGYNEIMQYLDAHQAEADEFMKAIQSKITTRLSAVGIHGSIYGRIKHVYSIYRKMKAQGKGINELYDMYAFRVIVDTIPDCYNVLGHIHDLFNLVPGRFKDYISTPKPNGYQSLHTTVIGHEGIPFEVQIRTRTMDEQAEYGVAAHWKYKEGLGGHDKLDERLAWVSQLLENQRVSEDSGNLLHDLKSDLLPEEVFAFTPKGDLLKFPKGATVLDFAYHIHSRVGDTCVGGKVNGKNVSFRTPLHSGDTVEILTASNQTPKPEWLRILVTSRARAKLRLSLKETRQKQGLYAKELLERRLKNKKLDYDEATVAHLIRKMGFKEQSDFYHQIAEGRLDPTRVLDEYQALVDQSQVKEREAESAENFEYAHPATTEAKKNDDVLIIDKSLKGIDFSLARCCHPIYGDKVFGFVTVNGGIKIHRADCPNAAEMQRRFGYRIVRAQWSGKGSSHYDITLRVIGNDDIGIVSNITNIISKDEKIVMRSINIDSHDGLFSGNLVVQLDDKSKLNLLIKKLRTVKGVKQVIRL